MHMLSDGEIERLKTDSNFTISHLAFCLSEEKQKSQRLANHLEKALDLAKKQPRSQSEQEIVEGCEKTLMEA